MSSPLLEETPSIRRSLSALLVTATVASGAMLAAPADAATAGGSCTLDLPRRIVVDDLVVIRTASASGSCTKAEAEAVWTTDPSFDVTTDDEDALDDVAGFAFYLRGDEYKSYGRDAVTFVFAPNAKWGDTTFYPAYAGRGCNDDGGSCKTTYVQNTPTTDVRLASRSALEANRSKGIVTLRGTGKVFSVDRQRYRPASSTHCSSPAPRAAPGRRCVRSRRPTRGAHRCRCGPRRARSSAS